jgi:hypothetical protein
LPLADLHHFEHVEQAMGLNDLSHQHPADVRTYTRVSAEPEEARSPKSWGPQTATCRVRRLVRPCLMPLPRGARAPKPH